MIDKRSVPIKTKILLNNEEISRDFFIEKSKDYSSSQISIFLKIIKQGGILYIKEDKYQFIPLDTTFEIQPNIDIKTIFLKDSNENLEF